MGEKKRELDPIFFIPVECKWCHSCVYRNGPPPWADDPDKNNCLKYPFNEEDIDFGKPDAVERGEKCPHYKRDLGVKLDESIR